MSDECKFEFTGTITRVAEAGDAFFLTVQCDIEGQKFPQRYSVKAKTNPGESKRVTVSAYPPYSAKPWCNKDNEWKSGGVTCTAKNIEVIGSDFLGGTEVEDDGSCPF